MAMTHKVELVIDKERVMTRDYEFDVNLTYREKRDEVSDADGKVGVYLGSGDGEVSGDRIQGTVRWDLFERQAPAACDAHFRGVIETQDGATIRFDVLGFFIPPKKPDKIWRFGGSVLLAPDGEGYDWLRPLPATWQGQFDEGSYTHQYRVRWVDRPAAGTT